MSKNNGANTEHGIVTAYKNYASEAQEQNLPGLDSKMNPGAEHLRVEKWDNEGNPYLEEYKGHGRLEGKNALITGGDSGIGRSVALFFAREGANVTISYLPEEQQDAEDVAKLIRDAPMGTNEVLLVPGNLEDESYCRHLVQKHLDKWGSLQILVNNASKQFNQPDISKIDLANVESTFRSNILAMVALVKFSVPHMKRGATIINSTSVTAFKGSNGMVDYSATKGAILSLTRSLAMQLASKGIRVNAVAPGPVYTPLQPASRSAENMEGWAIGDLPWPQRPLQPAEMAPAYVFCADNASSNGMTGQTIDVNNGQLFH